MKTDGNGERAAEILDEIGFISGSSPITSNAILFVGEMQERLSTARAMDSRFRCSEKQLNWLEQIYEKVS